jgi:hypothetical protein
MISINNELKFIFNNINDWLKYAENKNAILIGLNGGALFGIVNLFFTLYNKQKIILLFYVCLLASALMFLISTIILLISFIPQLICKNKKNNSYDFNKFNILYFSDIVNFDENTYLLQLAKVIGIPSRRIEKIDYYYAQQIIINSKIALRKYKLFVYAVTLDLLGLLPMLIFVLYFIGKVV